MKLNYNFGDIVALNGSPSKINIIVAKRKTNFSSMFGYDYFSMNNFAFWMINSYFREDMISKNIDLTTVEMPEKYEEYNIDEQLRESYDNLKKSFRDKYKSDEFELISKDEYLAVVSRVTRNTFEQTIIRNPLL